MTDWYSINKCPIWKVLGVIECNDCREVNQCWGNETHCTVECQFCPYPCNSRGENNTKEVKNEESKNRTKH